MFFFLLLSDCSSIHFDHTCFTCLVFALHPLDNTLSTFKSQKVHAMIVSLYAYQKFSSFNLFVSVVYPAGVTKNCTYNS